MVSYIYVRRSEGKNNKKFNDCEKNSTFFWKSVARVDFLIIFAVKSKHTTIMNAYIITETDLQDHAILRTWVCLSEVEAIDYLQKRYDIACSFNRMDGKPAPSNCLDFNFFIWREMGVKYNVRKSPIV